MKTKIILIIVFSLCTTNIVAQTISKNSKRNAVNKNAVVTIYSNGMTYSSACIEKNEYKDCERFNNTVFELFKICKTYNYQEACNNADTLLDYDSIQRTTHIKI